MSDIENLRNSLLNPTPYPPMGSREERVRLERAAEAEHALARMINEDITYEVSGNEPLHPDPQIASRMTEAAIYMACGYGCKIYADPMSKVRVLAHNSAYGCKR